MRTEAPTTISVFSEPQLIRSPCYEKPGFERVMDYGEYNPFPNYASS
jgi:hypothetical protein